MASEKNKKTMGQQDIISKYMQYVLEHDAYPKSVYKFCKTSKIKEEEFYQFYSSVESINKGIWNVFFTTTTDLMYKNEEYNSFSSRDKMLTFFYTFFELLRVNRSYVLFTLKQHRMPLKNLEQLRGLRKHIKGFAMELIESDNEEKLFKVTRNPVSIYSEGAWLHFLFILKFWVDDESRGFEKTDIAIEKSVHTIFDLFDNTPLNNVLDFGKFLWKEKVM